MGQKRNARRRRRPRPSLQDAMTADLMVILSPAALAAGDLAGTRVGDTAPLVLELFPSAVSPGAERDRLIGGGLWALVAGTVVHRSEDVAHRRHHRAVVQVGGLAIFVLGQVELPATDRVLMEGALRARRGSPADRGFPSATFTWQLEAIERTGAGVRDLVDGDVEGLAEPARRLSCVPGPEDRAGFHLLRLRMPSPAPATGRDGPTGGARP